MKLLDKDLIIKYIDSKNLSKREDFIKTLYKSFNKIYVFNKRFFENWTFLKLSKSLEISDAMTGHIYRDAIILIEKCMYRDMKKEIYEKAGFNKEIELAFLPLGKRLKCLTKDNIYLDELCSLTITEFLKKWGCGKRTLNELIDLFNIFGLKFKDED